MLIGLIEIAIRLVGGRSNNEGRLEVHYNGEWGTVCDDGWDDTDAGVVCRQLGFGSSGTAIGLAAFGQGSGSILLDKVSCNGNELFLAVCSHLGINVTRSCSHAEDAGVMCSSSHGMYNISSDITKPRTTWAWAQASIIKLASRKFKLSCQL